MTDFSSERIVRPPIERVLEELEHHRQVVDLRSGDDDRPSKAVDWLLATRNQVDGYWGYRSAAVTATCIVAVAIWRPSPPPPDLQDAGKWLVSQAVDGRWETVWDSGMAMSALEVLGQMRPNVAGAATKNIYDLHPARESIPAHHCAQVLLWHLTANAPLSQRQIWIDATLKALHPHAGPYVIGQAIHALVVAGVNPANDTITSFVDPLAEHLRQTPLSTSALLDHTAALRALAVVPGHEEVVDLAVDSLFSSALRSDGSWYHDPWYTAWALLALHEVRSVRRYVVEQPTMHRLMESLSKVPDAIVEVEQVRKSREVVDRWKLLGWAALFLVTVLAVPCVVLLLPDTNRLFTSGIAFTVLLWPLVRASKALWSLLRPTSGPQSPQVSPP